MRANLHIVEPYQPSVDDVDRENEMQALLGRAQCTRDRDEYMRLMDEYRRLHEQRPAAFVDWMERALGLKNGR